MDRKSSQTRRIARNTLMLYVRMLVLMLVGLYTSRVVLDALGENDFGIYDVVGGVVAMFTIISGSLNSAISRFITFELGKTDGQRLNKVYSTAVLIQLVIAAVVVSVAEPVGLWFISNEMTIDPSRIPAARTVLHFSLASFVINMMSVPQMASITAHEKMSAYAYIGLLDGFLRLGAAVLISRSSSDRLVLYAALMTMTVLLVRMAYGLYCRRYFPECRFRMVRDLSLVKEMFSFAGWNFIGVSAGVLRDQGGKILINIFTGPAVNAARGVALQLSGAVQGFVTNFMTAVNPQITKSYAAGDREYMYFLISKSSRMSYYLLFVLALPVLFNTGYLLDLWLKDVPSHSELFVQLFIVFTLSESLSNPLITAQLATGNIRNYQLVVGGLQLLNIPVSYVFLKLGAVPEVTVMVAVAISQICLFARLFMLRGMIGLPAGDFLKKVYLNVIAVSAAALVVPLAADTALPDTFSGFAASVTICVCSAGLSVMFIGLRASERRELASMLKDWLRK
ncbi:MAG: lipopolysaccharide biosynthesis protein [Bacteroidales bacterium]|nr:lipopolysaccharide biosynthesis protein [Bacteroidales bacterium]